MIYKTDIETIYKQVVEEINIIWVSLFFARQLGFKKIIHLETWIKSPPKNITDLRFLKTLNKVYKAIYKHNNDIIYSLIK